MSSVLTSKHVFKNQHSKPANHTLTRSVLAGKKNEKKNVSPISVLMEKEPPCTLKLASSSLTSDVGVQEQIFYSLWYANVTKVVIFKRVHK